MDQAKLDVQGCVRTCPREEEERCSEKDEPPDPPSSAGTGKAAQPNVFQALFPTPPTKRGGFPISTHIRGFKKRYFPHISSVQWNDWRWQLRERVKTLAVLERFLTLTENERRALGRARFPFAVTPYYLSLLDPLSAPHPLRRSVIPVMEELLVAPEEMDDPLGEEHDSPAPGIVHRYPDRLLFLVTSFCSTYCRYCTRSRLVGRTTGGHGGRRRWTAALEYIASHREIRDVLISGGDPLTLSDDAIKWLLRQLRAIRHVEIIRIGTKVPMVLPQRITKPLVKMLKRFHPLWMSIHVTHPEELTEEAVEACSRLADVGIPLGSQTVLLKGINDSVAVMKRLVQKLLTMRVRPYYLYQCDPIHGSRHFRTPVAKGIEIIEGLRGHTTGYAVPSYVIDAPGGGGKIPLLPAYLQRMEDQMIVLRNYEGRSFRYPDLQ